MSTTQSRSGASLDDEVLIARARDGDNGAVGELMARSREAVVRFCLRYLGDPHEAEDAAQDVLAQVASGSRWPEGAFRPWLYRMARNRCLDLLKARRGGRVGAGPLVRDSRWPSPRTGPRTALLRDERRERIRGLVAAMPEPHREVLILRYFEDLSRGEIAQVLGLPVSLVKSRLFEARQKLKERLYESEGAP